MQRVADDRRGCDRRQDAFLRIDESGRVAAEDAEQHRRHRNGHVGRTLSSIQQRHQMLARPGEHLAHLRGPGADRAAKARIPDRKQVALFGIEKVDPDLGASASLIFWLLRASWNRPRKLV